jgi:hypothetical protein
MRNNQNRLGQSSPVDTHAPAATASGLNYAVPTEFVQLPSRGKFYPEGHPLHGEKTVEIKYMTAKEEDILASTALIEQGVVIDRLLQNIVIGDIDVETLLIGDRSAMMVAARISAYGNVYTSSIVCNHCVERQTYDFDLNKSTMIDQCFDKNFLEENHITIDKSSGIFEIELPISKIKVGVRLLIGADEKIEDSDIPKDSVVTTSLAKFITSVDGNNDKQVVSQFIDSMLAADSRYLRVVIPSLTPTIDLKQDFVCKVCKAEDTREVPLSAEFFWPR